MIISKLLFVHNPEQYGWSLIDEAEFVDTICVLIIRGHVRLEEVILHDTFAHICPPS